MQLKYNGAFCNAMQSMELLELIPLVAFWQGLGTICYESGPRKQCFFSSFSACSNHWRVLQVVAYQKICPELSYVAIDSDNVFKSFSDQRLKTATRKYLIINKRIIFKKISRTYHMHCIIDKVQKTLYSIGTSPARFSRLSRRGVREQDATLCRAQPVTDQLDACSLDSYRTFCKTSEIFWTFSIGRSEKANQQKT